MADAYMKVRLTKITYPSSWSGAPQPNLKCTVWTGLVDFAVLPNGNYAATGIPFGPVSVPYGGAGILETLIYDGVGGSCAGTGTATLVFRVTTEGTGPEGEQAIGSAYDDSQTHPDPPRGLIRRTSPKVAVKVTDKKGKSAWLWFIFDVQSTC